MTPGETLQLIRDRIESIDGRIARLERHVDAIAAGDSAQSSTISKAQGALALVLILAGLFGAAVVNALTASAARERQGTEVITITPGQIVTIEHLHVVPAGTTTVYQKQGTGP